MIELSDKEKKEILDIYNTSRNSIQDIARIKRVDVETVLAITGHDDLISIHVDGDLIDESEAGPQAQMNYGEQYKIPYTTN